MAWMNLKLAGLLLLVGAGSTVGFYKAYELRRRISDIIMLQNTFRLLETEIYYSLTPIPIALKHLEGKLPSRIQPFFYQVCFGMEKAKQPIYQAWELALPYITRFTACQAEELEAIRDFGVSFGEGDVVSQQQNFQLLHQRLQHALEGAERARAQKERIWQYMGVCISLAVAMMLY